MAPPKWVPFKSFLKVLDACAVGYEARETTHSWFLKFQGVGETVPRGPHDKRKNLNWDLHRKDALRVFSRFGIKDCAAEIMPELYR